MSDTHEQPKQVPNRPPPEPFAKRRARREEAEEADVGTEIRQRHAEEGEERIITPLEKHPEEASTRLAVGRGGVGSDRAVLQL